MFELPKHSRVGGWNPTPQLCVVGLMGFQAWLSCPGLLSRWYMDYSLCVTDSFSNLKPKAPLTCQRSTVGHSDHGSRTTITIKYYFKNYYYYQSVDKPQYEQVLHMPGFLLQARDMLQPQGFSELTQHTIPCQPLPKPTLTSFETSGVVAF